MKAIEQYFHVVLFFQKDSIDFMLSLLSVKVPAPVTLKVPILAQDPPMINRVSTVYKMMMMTLNTTAEHKHHHRLQPGNFLGNHSNLSNLCQALEWDGDVVEGGVVNPINLFGDQTFLVWQQPGQLQLVQVSDEKLTNKNFMLLVSTRAVLGESNP